MKIPEPPLRGVSSMELLAIGRASPEDPEARFRHEVLALEASGLTVNAWTAAGGKLTVRLLDGAGRPLGGFGAVELRGDATALPARWGRSLSPASMRRAKTRTTRTF